MKVSAKPVPLLVCSTSSTEMRSKVCVTAVSCSLCYMITAHTVGYSTQTLRQPGCALEFASVAAPSNTKEALPTCGFAAISGIPAGRMGRATCPVPGSPGLSTVHSHRRQD